HLSSFGRLRRPEHGPRRAKTTAGVVEEPAGEYTPPIPAVSVGVRLPLDEPRACSSGEQRTRILVADPLLIFRSGMRSLLSGQPEFELIEAANGAELEAAVRERPDVGLIDLNLPPDGGIAALRRLLEIRPIPAVIWSFEPAPDTVL